MAEFRPHEFGSFDYKVTHPTVKRVLKQRSYLDNTTQISMPFINATTTIEMPEYLGDGLGFSLGLHAINEDVLYSDMYGASTSEGRYPLVGYTHGADGKPKRIYCNPSSLSVAQAQRFFDQNIEIANTTRFGRIPPPGITNVTVGRNKNGLLAVGEIQFSVPSLPQLEYLHRLFLIPGCGMILEWGQQFAQESLSTFSDGEFGAENFVEFNQQSLIAEHMLPWHDQGKMRSLFNRLGNKQVGLAEILKNYVYPTNGQYMWMFGRIANFGTKANSDGSYACNVKIVGPSEDQWAYSTRATVIPSVSVTNDFCDANSIERFFSHTARGDNLKTLLDDVHNGTKLAEWKSHIVKIPQGNKSEGNTTTTDTTPAKPAENANIDQSFFAESEDAYFFTWRFFINVILNDPTYGLKKIFADQFTPDQLRRVGVLRPFTNTDGTPLQGSGPQYLNDPMEPYVGSNKYLRSVNPECLIIVNEKAVGLAKDRLTNKFGDSAKDIIKSLTDLTDKTALLFYKDEGQRLGDFEKSVKMATLAANGVGEDRGFLSTGVWLNHKAVCRALVGAETFLRGISNLLGMMNTATMGYWQLTLDPIEPIVSPEDGTPVEYEFDNPENTYNYTVIDANWRGSSTDAVNRAINGGENGKVGLHVFNKYIRKDATNKLVGSELIECTVDLSLPKRLFSQIATLGLVQKEDLQQVGVDANPNEISEKTALVSDANETLRKMFAITTLSVSSGSVRGPDLTILPFDQRVGRQCSDTNSQRPGQVGGYGQDVANVYLQEVVAKDLKGKNAAELEELQKEANDYLEKNKEFCNQCFQQEQEQPKINDLSAKLLEPAAIEFIAAEEGLPRGGKAYWDPANQTRLVSIGYGHQIKEFEYEQGYIQAGDERISIVGNRGIDTVITPIQAKKLLEQDIPTYINAARSPIGNVAWSKLGTNQQVALTSYAYNTGTTRTLVRAGIVDSINRNDFAQGGEIIRDKGIRTAQGVVLPGLVNRRAKEGELFALQSTETNVSPVSTPIPTPTPPNAATVALCNRCKRNKSVVEQTTELLPLAQAQAQVEREFPNLNKILAFVEMFGEDMVTLIRGVADDKQSNAFGAAPGTLSIAADLVMPGINGFRVGELFWIDRIPAFYRAFGAFQVISIEEVISREGWQTKIHARFNYLGTEWKTEVVKLLNGTSGRTT